MKYRRELDGLRAFALLPVILFHAGSSIASGGYVGVDIFFVLSGYLISTILIGEMEEGSFSIARFYERRARRLLPALFFLMICVVPFAWLWLLPQDFRDFSASYIAVPLFVSNFLFYLTSGYFDTASEFKPFLHTWSLAVEEQYYLLFPIFLMIFWRMGKARIFSLIATIALLSVIAAQWASSRHPYFSFYLLPTRAFEILIGALIAFFMRTGGEGANSGGRQALNQALSAVGLLLIAYAIFVFDNRTPSPSLYTLIPTVGAALVIVFANHETFVGSILGSRALVAVGVISYSAYLWHQPLLAFIKFRTVSSPITGPEFAIYICVASLIIGFLSWKYIELPFRAKGVVSLKQIVIGFPIVACALIGLGIYGYVNDGLMFRFPDEVRQYAQRSDMTAWLRLVREDECHLQDPNLLVHSVSCHELGRPMIAIWGDSHAAALYPGLRRLQDRYRFGITQLTEAGCPPLINPGELVRANCAQINAKNLQELVKDAPDVLLLHSSWGPPTYSYTYQEMEKLLGVTLRHIRNALPKTKVVVVGSMPRWKISPAYTSFVYWTNHKGASVPSRLKAIQLAEIDDVLERVSIRENAQYISAHRVLCDDRGCLTRLGEDSNGFLQIDYGHLSKVGSEYFMEAIGNHVLGK